MNHGTKIGHAKSGAKDFSRKTRKVETKAGRGNKKRAAIKDSKGD